MTTTLYTDIMVRMQELIQDRTVVSTPVTESKYGLDFFNGKVAMVAVDMPDKGLWIGYYNPHCVRLFFDLYCDETKSPGTGPGLETL